MIFTADQLQTLRKMRRSYIHCTGWAKRENAKLPQQDISLRLRVFKQLGHVRQSLTKTAFQPACPKFAARLAVHTIYTIYTIHSISNRCGFRHREDRKRNRTQIVYYSVWVIFKVYARASMCGILELENKQVGTPNKNTYIRSTWKVLQREETINFTVGVADSAVLLYMGAVRESR